LSNEPNTTQLFVPRLQPLYDKVEPMSWLLIRLTAGLMLLPHGIPKLLEGVATTAEKALQRRGIEPAEPLAVVLIALETIGAVCIAAGLFTRFFAAALALEMAVIAYQYAPKFGWTGPGYEYPMMWGLLMLAIVMRGGGPYSLDRKWGKEL
jgi:putative oxidoreductase